MTDEEAKAVQEVAKATSKALEITEKVGPFLERVFGPLVENAVGVVSDRLRYYRLIRLYDLVHKTERVLAERNIKATRPVPPKLAVPLFGAATVEDDEALHDLWANLLATAMDPNAPQIKRSFIGILDQLEPSDARLLEFFYKTTLGEEAPAFGHLNAGGLNFYRTEMSARLDMDAEECEISLHNLDRLGCIALAMPGDRRPNERQFHITLTALGKALVEACMQAPPTPAAIAAPSSSYTNTAKRPRSTPP